MEPEPSLDPDNLPPDKSIGSPEPPGVPPGFLFSQSSLQDYGDCRRRFLLRYLLRLNWPAVESEPVQENEAYMEKGSRFHHLVQQSFSGVPLELLERQIHDDELLGWWQSFERFRRDLPPGPPEALPEISLSAPFGAFRLIAKYDLLLCRGIYAAGSESGGMNAAPRNSFSIYDWKTSRNRPKRVWLSERLQTRVYPYLLVRAGAALNGGQPIPPEAIEMIYWFTAEPDKPERFPYSQERFEEDSEFLTGVLDEIQRRAKALPDLRPGPGMAPIALTSELLDRMDAGFPRTAQTQRCAFCVYRSLCDRGEQAGDLADSDLDAEPPELDVHIELEQIAEIAF